MAGTKVPAIVFAGAAADIKAPGLLFDISLKSGTIPFAFYLSEDAMYKLLKQDEGHARRGEFTTPHGTEGIAGGLLLVGQIPLILSDAL